MLVATLTRFCRPVEAVARGVAAVHANSFEEPLVRAECQVETKWVSYNNAPHAHPSEVLPLPDTPYTPS